MKAKWLVEKGLFLDTEVNLIETLKRLQIDYKFIQYIPFDDDLIGRCQKIFPKDDCIIFYGSLNFGRKLKKLSWIPGVYLDETKYRCTSYYPIFGNLLIHKDYIMMPYGDLLRRKEFLFKTFGSNGHIFIRPDSGYKEFTGNVLSYDGFEDGVKLAGFYDVEPNLLVLVSDVKSIINEWRFVVVNQEIISGSLYRKWDQPEKINIGTTTRDYVLLNSRSVKEICSDNTALQFAKECAKLYNPEVAWTMDVAQLEDGSYGLLEIGCFSCAGLYGNDLEKVVSSVTSAAESEWKEYFE
jgi:hypothetical protein